MSKIDIFFLGLGVGLFIGLLEGVWLWGWQVQP